MTKSHFRKSNDLCCPSTTNPFCSYNLHSRRCLSSTSIENRQTLGPVQPKISPIRTCHWKMRIIASISPTPCTAPSACHLQGRMASTVPQSQGENGGDVPDH